MADNNKTDESLKFLQGNTLLYQRGNKGSKGIARAAFHSQKYFDTSVVFMPEHDFRIKLKVAGGVVSKPIKKAVADVTIKVWIHTPNEYGNFWSWTPQGKWVKTSAESVGGTAEEDFADGGKQLVRKLSHGIAIPPQAFFVNLS